MGQKKYPYVILRVMAAVYAEQSVRFVNEPSEAVDHREIVIHCADAYDGKKLTDRGRVELLWRVADLVDRSGYRRCVVFAPDDAVFVERGGKFVASLTPPHGGIEIKGAILSPTGEL